MINHLYYVGSSFHSSCHAEIKPDEQLWKSSNIEYLPEIVELAKEIAKNEKQLEINLSIIKNRYSNTVEDSYMSFGCCECDSIFGDFYVFVSKLDAMYSNDKIEIKRKLEINRNMEMPVPHWCFPDDKIYCKH